MPYFLVFFSYSYAILREVLVRVGSWKLPKLCCAMVEKHHKVLVYIPHAGKETSSEDKDSLNNLITWLDRSGSHRYVELLVLLVTERVLALLSGFTLPKNLPNIIDYLWICLGLCLAAPYLPSCLSKKNVFLFNISSKDYALMHQFFLYLWRVSDKNLFKISADQGRYSTCRRSRQEHFKEKFQDYRYRINPPSSIYTLD